MPLANAAYLFPAILEKVMLDDAMEVTYLAWRYKRKLRQAEGIYQAVWAVWALSYGLCWMVCHSCLL